MKSLTCLQQRLLQFAMFNLFLVAVTGAALRGISISGSAIFSFKNLLHGHSHFAMGGWITPLLTWLIMACFPKVRNVISYRHWWRIIVLILFSAYGMLLSFPWQGYGAVSIAFSTLSIGSTVYLALKVWKVTGWNSVHELFLRSSLIFLVLSSIGPLLTGPIIVSGNSGTPMYFNAIYFFLHFQYNGWFTFLVFAILYKRLEDRGYLRFGKPTFFLMASGCSLTFFLSTLWNQPHAIYYVLGSTGAMLQVTGVALFLVDQSAFPHNDPFQKTMHKLVFAALVMKVLLQFASSFPQVAQLAYESRNFIIAYLHLVMIGFVTFFGLAHVHPHLQEDQRRRMVRSIQLFIFTFIATELLLVTEAISRSSGNFVPWIHNLLFWSSVAFPVATLFLFSLSLRLGIRVLVKNS